MCLPQSQSSALTDDEVRDADSAKNGNERTIRAVYAQRKVRDLEMQLWQIKPVRIIAMFPLVLFSFSCCRQSTQQGMMVMVNCMK